MNELQEFLKGVDWKVWAPVAGAVLVGLLALIGTIGAALIGGGLIGHRLAHKRGMEELQLRKRTETLSVFFLASARAHGYREGHADSSVGVGEQIAGIYLIGDMGRNYPWLNAAATNQLDDQITYFETSVGQCKTAAETMAARMKTMSHTDTVDINGVAHSWDQALARRGKWEQEQKLYTRLLTAARGARAAMKPDPEGTSRSPVFALPKGFKRLTRR
ncbi:hypothetical protein [Kocuria rosea]|uniref:hypothetical protein n=1 Tax=Kocuria rosea TaxID=1275 RepID=UPI0025B773DE|nr:hypothetical protein [Kocuria rosea]WJZ68356.1 hypothetical protein QR564_18060 [Kocuria rosea]